MSLQNIIETAFENRAEITPASVSTEVKNAVLETLRQLDSGALRVAERLGVGEWKVNEWAKKAVLLSFRIADNEVQNDGVNQYFDKVPTKFADWSEEEFKAAGFRVGKYMPYGQVEDVIPYLIRRTRENTSVTGDIGRELAFIKQEVKRRGL